MIVFTLKAQRYDENDKPVGEPVVKQYGSKSLDIDRCGVQTTLEQQLDDEGAMKVGYGRRGVELYRDLAFAVGIRRQGWPDKLDPK